MSQRGAGLKRAVTTGWRAPTAAESLSGAPGLHLGKHERLCLQRSQEREGPLLVPVSVSEKAIKKSSLPGRRQRAELRLGANWNCRQHQPTWIVVNTPALEPAVPLWAVVSELLRCATCCLAELHLSGPSHLLEADQVNLSANRRIN